MLKSYEATYDNWQITWLSDQPQLKSARIIVTVLEETTPQIKRHFPVVDMVGRVTILGDIVSPIVDEEDWECLK
jgi:hypothetical protein